MAGDSDADFEEACAKKIVDVRARISKGGVDGFALVSEFRTQHAKAKKQREEAAQKVSTTSEAIKKSPVAVIEPPTNSLTTTCAACNGLVSIAAATCPHCGHPTKALPIVADTVAAQTTVPARGVRISKGLSSWAVLTIIVIFVWLIAQIAAPGYSAYSQKAAQTTSAVVRSPSDTTLAHTKLRSIVSYAEIFNATFQKIQYVPHADLPALAEQLQTIIGDAAAVEVPQCAYQAKQLIIFSMTSAHDAVRTNHVGGIGINNPAVIRQIELSSQLAADAQAAMRKMTC